MNRSTLGSRASCSALIFNFVERGHATLADSRVVWILTDVRRIVPATFALRPKRPFDSNGQPFQPGRRAAIDASLVRNFHLRDDEKSREARSMFSKQRGEVALRNQCHPGLETARNQLSRPRRLERLQHFFSNREYAIPIGAAFLVERSDQFLRGGK